MRLRTLLILCIIFNENESTSSERIRNIKNQKTVAILARLIDLVNRHGFSGNKVQILDNEDIYSKEQSYQDSIESHDKKESEEILDLGSVRLQVISNPETLEEYKMKIRENSNRFPLDQRRNAIFGLDTSSKEIKITEKLPNSRNNKDSKHNKIKIYNEEKQHGGIDDAYDNDKNGEADFNNDNKKYDKHNIGRKASKYDDGPNEDWDVATKNYKWDEKHKRNDDFTKKREIKQKKSKGPIRDDWDKITTQDDDWNKVTKESWPKRDNKDTYKPKKIRNKGKINTVKKTVYSDDNYKRPEENRKDKDWMETNYKPKLKTTRESYEWKKPYAPKITYNNPRPKKRGNYDTGSGFFGRTPIPYVGKRGIYEDK